MKPYSKFLKVAVPAFFLLSVIHQLNAQETVVTGTSAKPAVSYSNGIGIRSGTDFGLSYKHFTKTNTAFEGIISTGYKACDFTLLYEKHINVFNTSGMFFFYGGGAHAGFWERRLIVHYDPYYYYYSYYTYPSIGIAGIAGLEYKIPPIPFTIGLDLKPVIDFYYPGFAFLEGAFTARYVIN